MRQRSATSNPSFTQRHSARLSSHDDSLKSRINLIEQLPLTSDSNQATKPSLLYNTTPTISNTSTRHNFKNRNKPAELYRTDFITAMKLPHTEVLSEENYFLISDAWKLEWERGVQVPVKDDKFDTPNTCINKYRNNGLNDTESSSQSIQETVYKMPAKYLCPIDDKNFDQTEHEGYATHRIINNINLPARLALCKYDLDELDSIWLAKINVELLKMDQEKLSQIKFEKLMENFETQSHNHLKKFLDKLKNYSIEYDEGVVCEVCRAPDSEVTNEMVFCDGCNICVHQACYGIEKIPQGTWLCATCEFAGSAFKPECALCPNKGNAMKPTRNFRSWCHVSCALWIPETAFGSPKKMEPVIHLNKIPASRWQLVCYLCKLRHGCCVQCAEKKCHVAFHVTCAFKHNLTVQTVCSNSKSEEIVFKGFCAKHGTKKRPDLAYLKQEYEQRNTEMSDDTDNYDNNESLTKIKSLKRKVLDEDTEAGASANIQNDNEDNDEISEEEEKKYFAALQQMSDEERKIEILKRFEKISFRFYKKIDLVKIRADLDIKNINHVRFVFNYWKLKRRFNKPSNKALMMLRNEHDLMDQIENILILRANIFMHLRHDLERLRNLCYLIVKREKQKSQYFQLNRHFFEKQAEYLNKYKTFNLSINNNDTTTTQPFASKQPVTSELRSSGRIRDILQTRHDKIYDSPETWGNFNKECSSANF